MTVIEKLDMNVKQANSDFQAIKNKIVEKGVTIDDGTKTSEYASKVDEVYDAGKQAEYDAFWDAYQEKGNRKTCDYFFAGNCWTKGNLKPKYDIKPKRANQMFALSNFEGDLAQHFEDLGVTLDFSNCTMVQQIFANIAYITRVGVLDFSEVTSGTTWFINARGLITIDKLIVSEKTISPGAYAFEGCSKLENITIEGVISKKDWDFRFCPKLSKASITSVINCLSTTTSGLSVTLSKTAKENAFTDDEWAALIATKPNWTISLV